MIHVSNSKVAEYNHSYSIFYTNTNWAPFFFSKYICFIDWQWYIFEIEIINPYRIYRTIQFS